MQAVYCSKYDTVDVLTTHNTIATAQDQGKKNAGTSEEVTAKSDVVQNFFQGDITAPSPIPTLLDASAVYTSTSTTQKAKEMIVPKYSLRNKKVKKNDD